MNSTKERYILKGHSKSRISLAVVLVALFIGCINSYGPFPDPGITYCELDSECVIFSFYDPIDCEDSVNFNRSYCVENSIQCMTKKVDLAIIRMEDVPQGWRDRTNGKDFPSEKCACVSNQCKWVDKQ